MGWSVGISSESAPVSQAGYEQPSAAPFGSGVRVVGGTCRDARFVACKRISRALG